MAVFKITFMAETLGRTVPLTVILPTDKVYMPGMPVREAGKPYKTLYLLILCYYQTFGNICVT